MTGSLGIFSEALHSGLDMVAAVITFLLLSLLINRPMKDIILVTEKLRIIRAR
jgi:divalent metal cation (Fe/Co/Zn/Cd) transporter